MSEGHVECDVLDNSSERNITEVAKESNSYSNNREPVTKKSTPCGTIQKYNNKSSDVSSASNSTLVQNLMKIFAETKNKVKKNLIENVFVLFDIFGILRKYHILLNLLIKNKGAGDEVEVAEEALEEKEFSCDICKKNYAETEKLNSSDKITHIETLRDSLTYFNLTCCLEKLEESLENVRRKSKKKEDHEELLRQIDKKIQKLSFKYHPDKVRNQGSIEKKARNMQTAINATRTALKLLNLAFLVDIGIDHKFNFYTNLSIHSLSNEDEIERHITYVRSEIGVISEIKQQNIIAEIRKFLIESKNCIGRFLEGDKINFENYRDLAVLHLEFCIVGFKDLSIKLEEIKKEWKSKENCQDMLSSIQDMAKESKEYLNLLKLLNKTVTASLKGTYKIFETEESMDSYFVLPLVCYTNVILMCNVIARRTEVLDRTGLDLHCSDDLNNRTHSHYNDKKYNKEAHFGITVDKIKEWAKFPESGTEKNFYTFIRQINELMEYTFDVENYREVITTDSYIEFLEKCMTMMREFEEKRKEISEDINELKKKNEEMDKKCEKLTEFNEKCNQEIKEKIEQSKF